MRVKFKKPYMVNFKTETQYDSGEFIFKKNYSYEGEIYNDEIRIWNDDKSVIIGIKINNMEEYLYD